VWVCVCGWDYMGVSISLEVCRSVRWLYTRIEYSFSLFHDFFVSFRKGNSDCAQLVAVQLLLLVGCSRLVAALLAAVFAGIFGACGDAVCVLQRAGVLELNWTIPAGSCFQDIFLHRSRRGVKSRHRMPFSNGFSFLCASRSVGREL